MWDTLTNLINAFGRTSIDEAALAKALNDARYKTPIPVFWLLGKTQSGKTSIVRFLSGAQDAEIGQGFRPCTRFSRLYDFPTPEAPLISFLDTRGLGEPGYNPQDDLAKFNESAHVVIVTVKLLDSAQEVVLEALRPIRASQPSRPVVLVLTCLHEAYPQQQHILPYAAAAADDFAGHPSETLRRAIAAQKERFAGLVDAVTAVDLTPPIDGFNDANYGGERLRETLLEKLPAAQRETLIRLDEATAELQEVYLRQALPVITAYSTLAASAGALPIPFMDLMIVPAIQGKLVMQLAKLYNQPLTGDRFRELAAALGLGVVSTALKRQLTKFLPGVGSIAGAAMAGAATYALGRAFCYYYQAVCRGHVPNADDLKHFYDDQLAKAEQTWRTRDGKGASS